VPDKDRRKVAAELRPIYTAPNAEAAETELERFDETWGERYPMIAKPGGATGCDRRAR
jgi:putative transposase